MLDIAAAFPDVTLIFDHGGIQAGSWERFYEECLTVIAANDNVYVETGLWWRELYERPLMTNIGPSKLLWGTDWGASMQIYSQLGATRRATRSSCATRASPTTRSTTGAGACAS